MIIKPIVITHMDVMHHWYKERDENAVRFPVCGAVGSFPRNGLDVMYVTCDICADMHNENLF